MGIFSSPTIAGAAIGANDAQLAMDALRQKLQQQAFVNDLATKQDAREQQTAAELSAERTQNREVALLGLHPNGSDDPITLAAAKDLGMLTTVPAVPATTGNLGSTSITGVSTLPGDANPMGMLQTSVSPAVAAAAAVPEHQTYAGNSQQQKIQNFTKYVQDNPDAAPLEILTHGIASGIAPGDMKDILLAIKPAKPAAITGPELDARAQTLYAKKLSGVPLTPAETFELNGYEERKRVISDPAQLAATDRQNRTIDQQVAQQKRAQDFQEAQAARKEIADKIEQPYLDSQSKMDVLRSGIDLAKHGNMVAGSLTPLLATLGVVTSEGVKRINATEVQQVQAAGSLLDNLQGRWGKVMNGQPMDAKLQADTIQLADLLENSAKKKYLAGLNATKTRYKDNPLVASEMPIPGSEMTSTPMATSIYPPPIIH